MAIYSDVLKGLRLLMIDRMVRPEEVLVSTDDHGNVVRDYVRDTDSQQQYKTMRETLVYLSHLDFANTEEQMLEKLRTQLSGSLEWDKLNTLCWVRLARARRVRPAGLKTVQLPPGAPARPRAAAHARVPARRR